MPWNNHNPRQTIRQMKFKDLLEVTEDWTVLQIYCFTMIHDTEYTWTGKAVDVPLGYLDCEVLRIGVRPQKKEPYLYIELKE